MSRSVSPGSSVPVFGGGAFALVSVLPSGRWLVVCVQKGGWHRVDDVLVVLPL